jgi:23S rRNA (cytidine1920-2'-O)/16S rRNA (cytidine1409-2'-O)-methyltransferase
VKYRLDVELVRRGLARSRDEASDLISQGIVLINGIKAQKPASQVTIEDSIVLKIESSRFVSRGGIKLSGALTHFKIDSLQGKVVLDAGASTGGFTDVVLQLGAERVIAVDVGYGQLAWSLQNNPQVKVMDRKNIRELKLEEIGSKVDLIVADLSFISLTLVIEKFIELVKDGGDLILMVKPQFEVGRERLGSGGVVRDEALRKEAVMKVASRAFALGWGTRGVVASSLPGPSGNVEYFIWLRQDSELLRESDLDDAVEKGPK